MNKKYLLLALFPIAFLTTGCNNTPKIHKPSFAAKGTQVTASVFRDTFRQHYQIMQSNFFGAGYSFTQNTELDVITSNETKYNTTGKDKLDSYSQTKLHQNIDTINRRYTITGYDKRYQRTINNEKFIQSYTNTKTKKYSEELGDSCYSINIIDKTYYIRQNSSWGTKAFDAESLNLYSSYFPSNTNFPDDSKTYSYYIKGNVLTMEAIRSEMNYKTTSQWSFGETIKYKYLNTYLGVDGRFTTTGEFQMKKSTKSVKKYTLKSDYKLILNYSL